MSFGGRTREVGSFIYRLRTFLLGREYKPYLRFQEDLSPRPGPVPDLPYVHKEVISANQYHERDARRLYLPSESVVDGSVKKLAAPEKEVEASTKNWPPLPGKPYSWKKAK
ncbi:uncharacterized protein B4U80_03869 [Leptotrombidium deliense]|uniref:NADH dehydrogenase [ubiquinone] 1 alpha subcomplex subunit 7 n=1 Tax=Leptotrombidium deliense TaxID=299467 RepID=A0A443S1B1_9ACAR|nr:uncharacterized protein B4U80_03869 [Leptotrombidium deliense]